MQFISCPRVARSYFLCDSISAAGALTQDSLLLLPSHNTACIFREFKNKKRERVRSYLPSNPLGITPSVTGPPKSFSYNIKENLITDSQFKIQIVSIIELSNIESPLVKYVLWVIILLHPIILYITCLLSNNSIKSFHFSGFTFI